MESDTQPEEVTSANTEINALTDKLEAPPTEDDTGPIKDVTTFWTRLDSLLTNLEETEATKKKPAFKSFTNQPERVCISSDNDISTAQSQNNITEQTFSSFKVNIARPFLEVKSIQLLRASIPNAVTNIPDEECTFWYYKLPIKAFSGAISVTAPTPPNQPTPTPNIQGYTTAVFSYLDPTGAIHPQIEAPLGISQVFVGSPGPGYILYRCSGPVTGFAAGSRVDISGVSPAGYNGTFNVYSVIGAGSPNDFVVVANFGAATLSGATVTMTITDTINFSTTPYTLTNASGVTRGYFLPPSAFNGSVSIYPNWTKAGGVSGAPFGTITRLSDFFIPPLANEYLHMIRLLPSYYKAELFEPNVQQDDELPPASRYGYNRTFTDYQDLATELANSCAADPSYDSSDFYGLNFPIFEPNDISITYNSALNKFIFTGNNDYDVTSSTQLSTYLSAGYEDPLLWQETIQNYHQNAYSLQQFTTAECTGFGDFPLISGINGQPYKINRTLNLRLGFTWNGVYSDSLFPINTTELIDSEARPASILITFLNRLRPIPEYFFISAPAIYGANGPFGNTEYTADSYANLVYTNTVSLYADFTGASTYDSMTNTQLLACVPMNASNLGVTFYNTSLYCPLTKISDQIYEIEIRMLTDTGAPYVIPNSCIVSLELALTY
jgi:hypothetical protein